MASTETPTDVVSDLPAEAQDDRPPLDDLWRLVAWRAARTPDALFILDDYGRSPTFGESARDAEEVAAGLTSLGVSSPATATRCPSAATTSSTRCAATST